MLSIQNKAIADVVSRLARGSAQPVQDGVLRQAVSPYSYDAQGSNFESVPGPTGMDQVHPEAGTGPNLSLGQTPLMAVTPGAAARTGPGALEGRDFGAPRVSHTGMERGAGVLTTDPQAIMEMLASMGLPDELIMQALAEMGYQR